MGEEGNFAMGRTSPVLLVLLLVVFPICDGALQHSLSQRDGGGDGHHGQDHHGSGCHMERTDARVVTFVESGSTVQCTSTHSQCKSEVLIFDSGCDTLGCFIGVTRQLSGESYRVTFNELHTSNETHMLNSFSWNAIACETKSVNGISGLFCSTQGTKIVEGAACQMQWSLVLPSTGMMTTARYSCRPDTMKLDLSFSSCVSPSLTLRATLAGPNVDATPRTMTEESFGGAMEQGVLLQDDHTYFSWIPHANNNQMPIVSQAMGGTQIVFTIDSRNASLVTWDPKLAASSSDAASIGISVMIVAGCILLNIL